MNKTILSGELGKLKVEEDSVKFELIVRDYIKKEIKTTINCFSNLEWVINFFRKNENIYTLEVVGKLLMGKTNLYVNVNDINYPPFKKKNEDDEPKKKKSKNEDFDNDGDAPF